VNMVMKRSVSYKAENFFARENMCKRMRQTTTFYKVMALHVQERGSESWSPAEARNKQHSDNR